MIGSRSIGVTRFVGGLLTAAVMALTVPAFADPPPADPAQPPAPATSAMAAPAAAPAPASTGTPLKLRSSSITGGESSGGGSLWKLGAFAAVIAGAAYWMRRKRGALGKAAGPARTIQVLSRASVGVRTELVMVEVDGVTLLLGVTPASVSRLAILSAGEIEAAKDEQPEEESAEDKPVDRRIPERFGALLEGIKKASAPRRGSASDGSFEPRLVVADEPAPVEPQARGLLALRKR